ncbi:MAG: CRTAC1 family protein [Acidobacteriota bacterium]|nr:CRTAC1 family protein [Acidobacteriota bacterium]
MQNRHPGKLYAGKSGRPSDVDAPVTNRYLQGLRDRSAVLALLCLVLASAQPAGAQAVSGVPEIKFVNVAARAGVTAKTVYGDESKNKYLLETTGSGAAFFDYDNDGWQDIFLVNGTRLDPPRDEPPPTNRLYRNRGDGTFQDVTAKAGLVRTGWGQSACVGDYDNDGHSDLFVSAYGQNALYHNNGDGTFTEVAARAGVANNRTRWASGSAFLDYDRDGRLDLFVASYINLDLKTAPLPETGPCLYKGLMVACGPPGLAGGVNALYRNNGDGTFADVSEKSGVTKANGTYGLGVLVADFDNDGWPDVYVANDSAPAALYHNNRDGTFTDIGIEAGAAFSIDGKPQAGMGVAAGDYDRDGWLDIVKTNFAGDTSTLYRNVGRGEFDDVTFPAGLGVNTRWLGWGCGFVDVDNDGWPDIFLVNGHVYPEVARLAAEAGYAQRKVLYRNAGNGRFLDISEKVGGAVTDPTPARGCAFGDYDNDGDVDILINPVNAYPELLRAEPGTKNNWLTIKLVGTKSNRDGIGARVRVVTADAAQIDEVRSGGSYYSQNDLRVHFGVGEHRKVKAVEIRWPSGQTDALGETAVNQFITVKEGSTKAPAAK